MDVRLQRAWDPTDLGETKCGICGHEFYMESVWAWMVTDERYEAGAACPSCIEWLGKRNPEKFPTIEEYEAAKQRFPEPIFASKEELDREDPNWVYVNSVMNIERA